MAGGLNWPCGGGDYARCCGRFHGGEPAPGAEALALDPAARWLGLEVRAADEGGNRATVEFVARSRQGGRWYYLDGTFR